MALRFADLFPEIALLRRLERGVAQGDEAAIAEVRTWTAAEYIRLETRRGQVIGLASLVILVPVVVYFLATVTHKENLFDRLFPIMLVPFMWLGSRRSKLVRYIDDIELINSQFSYSFAAGQNSLGVGDTGEHEVGLMQRAALTPNFALTPAAETRLRRRAGRFKSVDDDAWATDQEWKHAVIALLAAHGEQPETGKLLESLAAPTKYGRLRPTVLQEMAAARDRFNSRFYS